MFIQKLIMNNVVFASSLHTGSSSISIKDVSPSLHLPKTFYVTQIYIQQCWISISYSTSPPASLLSLCHRSAMSAPYSKIRLCFHSAPNTPVCSPPAITPYHHRSNGVSSHNGRGLWCLHLHEANRGGHENVSNRPYASPLLDS